MKATIEHCRVKLLVLSVHCTGRLGLGFGHIVGPPHCRGYEFWTP